VNAEDFIVWNEQQPGDARYELLDGLVVVMASERVVHARAKSEVQAQFQRGIAAASLPCEAFGDGMAVRIDDETVFEPDALVHCGPRLPDDTVLIVDPLIVVEVVSPSSQRIDVITKFGRYFRNASIAHYLIVVTNGRMVMHHRRGPDGLVETTSHESGTIVLDPPGLTLDVTALFAAIG
jgi:Uma2 family endonuclease